MWIIAVPVAFVVLFIVYQFVWVPKMKARHNEKLKNEGDEFAASVVGKESETKKHFIQNDPNLKPVVFQIGEENIKGMISCQEKRETRDFLRQQAVNVAGKALGRITGVGVREVDNREHYFLVLTGTNLHYLHYSEGGACKEHLSFNKTLIQDIEAGKITSSDMLQNSAFTGETERLSFVSDHIRYKFFFYDKLYLLPGIRDYDQKKVAALNYLFARPFLDFVKNYRRT